MALPPIGKRHRWRPVMGEHVVENFNGGGKPRGGAHGIG